MISTKSNILSSYKSIIGNTVIITIMITIIYLIYPLSKKSSLPLTQQQQAININPSLLKIISLGQSRIISSLIWIETLLNSDISHYSQGNLENWMFLRFNTITDIDSHFYEAYLYGGIYLSIIKDDDQGAAAIYKKGLDIFTDDYYLNLNASFHYFYEMGDIEKSLKSLEKIYLDPRAPKYLPNLYARLKATKGDLNSAMVLLFELYQSAPEHSILKDSYSKKLYSIKAEIDLTCLNEHKKKCHLKDFDGETYQLLNNGTYKARKKWRSLKIKKLHLTQESRDEAL